MEEEALTPYQAIPSKASVILHIDLFHDYIPRRGLRLCARRGSSLDDWEISSHPWWWRSLRVRTAALHFFLASILRISRKQNWEPSGIHEFLFFNFWMLTVHSTESLISLESKHGNSTGEDCITELLLLILMASRLQSFFE